MPSEDALYERIAGDIERQITTGVLRVGDRLPSTRALTERYEVSETVVRFAMVHLKARGLVVGRPGRGVYVAANKPQC